MLREHSTARVLPGSRIAAVAEQTPDMGQNLAIDASDLPAYANGQRFLTTNGPSAALLRP